MNNIIINADDLGMSSEVNAQIEGCIRLGVITSSTLMANAPAFEEGARIAKQYPQISVGVHLNIIEFAPLTNVEVFRKYGIVGDDGNFVEGAIFCVRIDDELKQAIFEEWDAQINKIEKVGLTPTHCDSHEHTHTITALQETLYRVLDKHNIHRVRRKMIPSIRIMLRGKKQPVVHLDKSKAVQPKKHSVIYRRFHLFSVKFKNWRWNCEMAQHYAMTDAFYSFRDFYSNRNVLRMSGKNSVVELMCHPGNKPFQAETESLMNSKNFFDASCKLISYHEL